MSTNRTRRWCALLSLIVLLLPVSIPGYSSSESAYIRVANANGRTMDVKFSEDDLRKVQDDARYVLLKLAEKGAECCGPREKLSDCVWRCCDGTQVRTCNAILVKALNELSRGG